LDAHVAERRAQPARIEDERADRARERCDLRDGARERRDEGGGTTDAIALDVAADRVVIVKDVRWSESNCEQDSRGM
jgi:hypothetical protein